MPENTDWPTHTGPLKTLADLGLHATRQRPGWARKMRIRAVTEGTAYAAQPFFLNTDAIRMLAALTFEGYDIDISTPDHGDMQLVIYEKRRPTAA